MKKLYAILAAAIVAVGAFVADAAAPKLPQAIVTPETRLTLQKRAEQVSKMAEFTPGTELIGTRSYTVGNMLYTLRFIRDTENEWYKVLSFINPDTGKPFEPGEVTFDYFPFYNIMMVLVGYDISKGQPDLATYLPFYTVWPCYYYFSQYYENAGEEIPVDQRNLDIVSIEDLCNAAGKGFCGTFREWREVNGGYNPNPYLNADNEIEAWSITSGGFMKEVAGATLMFNGSDCTTFNSGNQIMEWIFRGYLPETDELSVGLKYPLMYKTSTGADRQTTLNVAFQGTYRQDIEPVSIVSDITDTHIFYTGEASSKTFGKKDPYILDSWGPLDRYYIFASMSEYIRVNIPLDLKEFNQDQIGFIFTDNAPAEVQLDPESQSYIFGSLYLSTGSQKPYGEYTMPAVEYIVDPVWGAMLKTKPEPNTIIPAYTIAVFDDKGNQLPADDSYVELDGLNVVYLGGNQNLLAGAKGVVGGKKGIEFAGTDLYNNTFLASTTGKFKFHADPKNVQAFEELDAVGDYNGAENIVDAENAIIAADGKVIVNAANDIEVNVYTLDGVAVKSVVVKGGNAAVIELGNGLYIVKAGNDVKKVVL